MGKYGHSKYVYFVDEILVQPGYLICIAHLWWKIGSQYILIIHCHNGQIIVNIQIVRKSKSRITILCYSLSLGP